MGRMTKDGRQTEEEEEEVEEAQDDGLTSRHD